MIACVKFALCCPIQVTHSSFPPPLFSLPPPLHSFFVTTQPIQAMTSTYSYDLNGATVRPEAKVQADRYFFHISMADKKSKTGRLVHMHSFNTPLTALASLSHQRLSIHTSAQVHVLSTHSACHLAGIYVDSPCKCDMQNTAPAPVTAVYKACLQRVILCGIVHVSSIPV